MFLLRWRHRYRILDSKFGKKLRFLRNLVQFKRITLKPWLNVPQFNGFGIERMQSATATGQTDTTILYEK